MNFKNSIFVVAFVVSSVAVAHNHQSTKEELLVTLIHAEKVNENLEKQVDCLKAVLAELKHKLHPNHRFHELVKALEHLKKAAE